MKSLYWNLAYIHSHTHTHTHTHQRTHTHTFSHRDYSINDERDKHLSDDVTVYKAHGNRTNLLIISSIMPKTYVMAVHTNLINRLSYREENAMYQMALYISNQPHVFVVEFSFAPHGFERDYKQRTVCSFVCAYYPK
jgi:hypothetical protein